MITSQSNVVSDRELPSETTSLKGVVRSTADFVYVLPIGNVIRNHNLTYQHCTAVLQLLCYFYSNAIFLLTYRMMHMFNFLLLMNDAKNTAIQVVPR